MPEYLSIPLKLAGLVSGASILAELNLPDHLALVAFSGLCGGVCRWIAERSQIWPHGAGNMVSGALVGTFMWPAAASLLGEPFSRLEMDPATAQMLGGFISGLLGITLIGFILDVFRARTQQKREEDGAGDA